MSQSTCMNPLCDGKSVSKGYCNPCYQRLRRTGNPNGLRCTRCGEYIWLRKPRGWRSQTYCSPDCMTGCKNPSCTATDLDRNGYCASCYMRYIRFGDADGKRCETCGNPLWLSEHRGARYCSPECRPRCAIPECGKPVKAFGLCATHRYRQLHGVPLESPIRETFAEMIPCRVCGADPATWDMSRQHFNSLCSPRCIHLAQVSVRRPRETRCQKCGARIDLMAITRGGHLVKADTKLCVNCRERPTRVRVNRKKLWDAQGGICAICGLQLDLTAKHPNAMAAVGDHIVPLARGGANAERNIALTHSLCNILKGSRLMSEIDQSKMADRIRL